MTRSEVVNLLAGLLAVIGGVIANRSEQLPWWLVWLIYVLIAIVSVWLATVAVLGLISRVIRPLWICVRRKVKQARLNRRARRLFRELRNHIKDFRLIVQPSNRGSVPAMIDQLRNQFEGIDVPSNPYVWILFEQLENQLPFFNGTLSHFRTYLHDFGTIISLYDRDYVTRPLDDLRKHASSLHTNTRHQINLAKHSYDKFRERDSEFGKRVNERLETGLYYTGWEPAPDL